MRLRTTTTLCFLLLLAACSNDGSSPVGPTLQSLGPPEPADVAGTWTATITASTDDIIGGGCLGNVARGLQLSTTRTATIVIEQDGGTLTETSLAIEDVTCRFTGSVTSTTLSATVDACTPDTISIGVVPGCGSDPWSLESLSLTMDATVSGPVITGTPTATATAVSGESNSHSVTATGQLSMSR